MTLADAEATALAGTIAEQEPRIERSGYVAGVEGAAALEAAGATDVYLYGRDVDLYTHLVAGGGHNHAGEPGGPIAMVELSQLGMDILGVHSRDAEVQPTAAEACRPVPGDQRYAVTVFYDPRSADTIGHTFAALPAGLWAVASGSRGMSIRSARAPMAATPSST